MSGYGMPIQAPFEFVDGLIVGMIGDNNLYEIQDCIVDAEDVVTAVEAIVVDLEQHKHLKLIRDAKKFLPILKGAVAGCEATTDEIKGIEEWATIFTDQTELVSTITKSMLKHPKEMTADIKHLKADWTAGMYKAAGIDAADLLTLALGPIKPVESEDPLIEAGILAGLPKLIEGFVYTFFEDSTLPELDTCVESSKPLLTYAENAIKDIEQLDIIKALENVEAFIYHMQLDLQPCMHMGDDVAAIEEWAKIFTDPTQLVETVTKHYLLHKKAISADIADFKASEAAGNYF
jgi:hypothetical protein